MSRFKTEKEINHPHIIKLKDFSVSSSSSLCYQSYWFKRYYEAPKQSLSRKLLDFHSRGINFSHVHLTVILYDILDALHHLHSQRLFHGQLSSNHISYDSDIWEAKLLLPVDGFADDAAARAYQLERVNIAQALYASPNLYLNLSKDNSDFKPDWEKEDLYSLGLILLEGAVGHSVQELYRQPKKFDVNFLNKCLDELSRNHEKTNKLLVTTLKSILKEDISSVPTIALIKRKLPSFDTVKNFMLKNAQVSMSGEPNKESIGSSSMPLHSVNQQASQKTVVLKQSSFTPARTSQTQLVAQSSSQFKNLKPLKPVEVRPMDPEGDKRYKFNVHNEGDLKYISSVRTNPYKEQLMKAGVILRSNGTSSQNIETSRDKRGVGSGELDRIPTQLKDESSSASQKPMLRLNAPQSANGTTKKPEDSEFDIRIPEERQPDIQSEKDGNLLLRTDEKALARGRQQYNSVKQNMGGKDASVEKSRISIQRMQEANRKKNQAVQENIDDELADNLNIQDLNREDSESSEEGKLAAQREAEQAPQELLRV